MIRMRRTLFLLLILLSGCLWAQEIIYEHYRTGTEFWVVIPYSVFIHGKGQDLSIYQLSVQIKNDKGKQVANHEKKLEIPRRDWLKDTAVPVFFTADLAAGKYKAEIKLKNLTLGDKRNLKKSFVLGGEFTEIGQVYYLVEKENIVFIPSSISPLPSEIGSCKIRLNYSAVADSIKLILDQSARKLTTTEAPLEVDLTGLVTVQSPQLLLLSFFEGNIRYNIEPFLYSQWFSYDLRYSYKEQIQQLRYIATQNEWQSLRALPESKYADGIQKFWEVHDPSPGTLRNEARESFYQRVIIADERYTLHKKLKGWASDRGRIFIKYGEPDEILTEVHPIGLYPYISWIYYRLNLEFVFADIGGYGQYTLRNKDEEY
jgi:GWxTD domain-containing protein